MYVISFGNELVGYYKSVIDKTEKLNARKLIELGKMEFSGSSSIFC